MQNAFDKQELETLARETGFLKRKSKVNPTTFFDLLIFNASSGKSKSLNQLAIEARSGHSIEISKQALDKKFNDCSLTLLRRLIERQLNFEIQHQIETEWLGKFNRVMIKDSTRFDLQEQYRENFPGSGGCASEAGACIQFEYDLKNGKIIELDITSANRPDYREAKEVMDDVMEGDLVIRDLGYHLIKSFSNIIKRDAFFISRLMPKTNVFILEDGIYRKLDFKELYFKMKKINQEWTHESVFIGDDKIPVTLLIERMPDEVYELRMRKTNINHRKKGYKTSEKYRFLARFNLFITNIPSERLPIRIIPTLYKIRWQIELIFKIWKSILGIHHNVKMKLERWLCQLYVKLLVMVINWNIIMTCRNYFYKHKWKLLSLNKCFKTLFDNNQKLREALKDGSKRIKQLLQWAHRIFNRNHWLEQKNKSINLAEILSLKICKSNQYAYI